jgi:hypothetical protein
MQKANLRPCGRGHLNGSDRWKAHPTQDDVVALPDPFSKGNRLCDTCRPQDTVTERQWPGAARSLRVASGTAGSQRPQQARARPGVLGGLTGLSLRLDSEPPHAPPPPPPQGCLQTRQVASEGPSPHGCQCLQLTLDTGAGSRHARPGRPGTGPGLLPCQRAGRPQAGGLWRSTRSAGGPALGAASESESEFEFESGISASQSALATGGSCGACQCQWEPGSLAKL